MLEISEKLQKSLDIPWDPPRKLYSKGRRNYLPLKNIIMNRAILFDMWKQENTKELFCNLDSIVII